jgi:hypothetical protein
MSNKKEIKEYLKKVGVLTIVKSVKDAKERNLRIQQLFKIIDK